MDPVTIAMLGMGVMNAAQNQRNAEDQKAEKVAAIRYRPWSNIGVPNAQPANPWGDLAQAGGAALGYEQNKEAAGLRKKLMEAQIAAINRGQSPYGLLRGDGSTDLHGNGAFKDYA